MTSEEQGPSTNEVGVSPRDGMYALEVSGLSASYGAIVALEDVSLHVTENSVATLLGPNGAGKTTLVRAVSGLLSMHNGSVTKGSIKLFGESLKNRSAPRIVSKGVAQVMEGRRIFKDFSVRDNLRAGAFTRRRAKSEVQAAYDRVIELFPVLGDRQDQLAGLLSGGEQQMLAIGRALMARPRVLILDEPLLGLAPRLVEQIANAIVQLRDQGLTLLLVEQNAAMALDVSDVGFILDSGSVVAQGTSRELIDNVEVQRSYLGMAGDVA